MKVLTLHQPWASLVALGVKSIETRSWSTQYRGPLAIHAAVRRPNLDTFVGEWYPYEDPPGYSLQRHPGGMSHPLSLGAIVATCTLVDVVPILEPGDIIERRSDKAVSVLGDSLLLCERFGAGPIVDIKDQHPYGDFTAGRYAWLLADVVPIDPPVPFKGGQGLTKTWEPAA